MMHYASLRAAAKAAAGKLACGHRVRRYLAASPAPRLNLGSSYNLLEGWLNIDLIGGLRGPVYADLSRRFPLPGDTFDLALCEHMIEHVPKAIGLNLIAETFRVLRPGGKFRVVTPDLAAILELSQPDPGPEAQAYIAYVAAMDTTPGGTATDVINAMFRNYGHQYIYSVEELRKLLEAAGFADIVLTRGGYPADPAFSGVEGHPHFMGFANNAFEAFALEARKPG